MAGAQGRLSWQQLKILLLISAGSASPLRSC